MFERIKYPDGQISARYIPQPLFAQSDYTIRQRVNSYEDLFFLRACAELIQKGVADKVRSWKLFIPCMFGQRSDRRFSDDQSFDLKVIAEFINQCKFEEVGVLDPHSDVTMALINNSSKISSYEYVEKTVRDIQRQTTDTDILLISPDAGAYKKVFEYGERLGLPVMGAMKHRDKDGKINLMFTHDVEGKDCLIVDDLCDGGKTFIDLGQKLKDLKARKVYLYVTHGLFSRDFKTFEHKIDHIYCTNSIKDVNIRDIGRDEGMFDFVTQYKVI